MLMEQMYARTGTPQANSPQPEKAWLSNYQLAFNMLAEDGQTYANIMTPGSGVAGVLYPCTEDTLARLDVYEKGYQRLEVTVTNAQEFKRQATTYIALAGVATSLTAPRIAYLDKILNGARQHGISENYRLAIQAQADNLRK